MNCIHKDNCYFSVPHVKLRKHRRDPYDLYWPAECPCERYEGNVSLSGVEVRLKSLEESNTLPRNHAHKLEQTQTALRDLQNKVSYLLKNGRGVRKKDAI